MEVYILDDLLRRVDVVDEFDSLIWTERFAQWGDFELVVNSTATSRGQFTTGIMLAMNLSYRVMVVETVENASDSDGQALITVKGRSLEMVLENRVGKNTMANLTTEPKWNLTGTPGAIARQMFHEICVTGDLDVGDKIPFIWETSIFPPDTIAEPSTSVTLALDPDTLYNLIKTLCDTYDLGFRLIREFDTSKLYFNIYTGSDRTTGQSSLAAVVFSPDLDNVKNTSSLTTIATSKNVAYVFTPVGSQIVYGDSVATDVDGFDRQVLFVRADDITTTVPADATAQMIQRGKAELSANRGFTAFDGEINEQSGYVYGTHYNLGDLVEIRDSDGNTNKMRVTEQIFVSDKEGDRSYPTLAINTFVMAGTWIAWDYNQVWYDLNASMTAWADQP